MDMTHVPRDDPSSIRQKFHSRFNGELSADSLDSVTGGDAAAPHPAKSKTSISEIVITTITDSAGSGTDAVQRSSVPES